MHIIINLMKKTLQTSDTMDIVQSENIQMPIFGSASRNKEKSSKMT
jgi:hypothetical protein